jgi:hypothetical protein
MDLVTNSLRALRPVYFGLTLLNLVRITNVYLRLPVKL